MGTMPTMATARLPQPVHDADDSSPAPGDLELVRGLLSLHDHVSGVSDSLEPTTDTLTWWLRANELVRSSDRLDDAGLAWALEIREALVAKVRENAGEKMDPELIERLNAAAAETGLRPTFDEPRLKTNAVGVHGAIARLLGIAFLAELDGSWHRFRVCADPTCATVFYDRSKNHSAKWCSMASCGNRNKARAFRERHAAAR